MRWYGHARREKDDLERRAAGIEVQERTRRERPKRRCWHSVGAELKEKGLTGEEVYEGVAWRRISSHIDPLIKMYIYKKMN